VFPPFLSQHYGAKAGDERRNLDADRTPLGTVVAAGSHHSVIVPPFMAELYGTGSARGIEQEALSTVTAGGNHHGLAVPPGAFLSKHHGGLDYARIEHMNKSLSEPMPVVVTSPNISLVVPERKRPSARFEGELPFELEDVRFRMVGPREHLRAQRFAEDYDTSAANKSETTKGAGNAVPVNAAHWIGEEIKEVFSV